MNLSEIRREMVVDAAAIVALPTLATQGQLAHVYDVLQRRLSVLMMSAANIPSRVDAAERAAGQLDAVRVELERRGVRIDT